MKLLTKKKQPNTEKFALTDAELPTIAILLAVYNEEKVIQKKLESTFQTTYPLDKIQFLIGSDNSTDETEKIISAYQQNYPQLQLHRFESRTGKPQIINHLASFTTADILILTDANIIFTPEHIYELVAHFKNPEIGVVGGNVMNEKIQKQGISEQETAYINRENLLKYQEGLYGCMIGAFGASYSIRRNLFKPTPVGFISDDFYISMQAIAQGKKAVFELNAIAYESFSTEISEEFRRKSRYAVGNYQNLFYLRSFWKRPFSMATFCYTSHKILRWFGPFFMLFALSSVGYLAFQNTLMYQIFAILAFTGILVISIDLLIFKNRLIINPIRLLSHFALMNIAMFIGFFKYLFTKPSSTWKPTNRT